MKKQIKHSIKAHLLWSALILLALLAVCAIPFALAQRNATKRSRAASISQLPKSQLPQVSSGPIGVVTINTPPAPQIPEVILYDQLNNPGTVSTGSQEFPDFPTFTDFTADDFLVSAGQSWTINEVDAQGVYFNGPGPADNFNVFFYVDNAGLPGTQVYAATAQSYVNNAGVFQVTLSSPATLSPGHYWVSVQAHMSFSPNGQWGWTDRTVQANSPAAWKNPGGSNGGDCLT